MKRFFVCFAVFAAMICTIGCNKLEWSDKNLETLNWYQAEEYCKNLNEQGKQDWRMPTIDELRTLVSGCEATATGGHCQISEKNDKLSNEDLSEDCKGCGLNENGYSAIPLKKQKDFFGKDYVVYDFWTSSEVSENSFYSFAINFGSGSVYINAKDYQKQVRCVRDGKTREDKEIVLEDKDSGLKWSKKFNALQFRETIGVNQYCNTLNFGGLKNWRLPTSEELIAIDQQNGKNKFGDTGCLINSSDEHPNCFSNDANSHKSAFRCVNGKVTNMEDKKSGLIFSSAIATNKDCSKLGENGLIWRSPNKYESNKFKETLFGERILNEYEAYRYTSSMKFKRCVSGKELFFTENGLMWSDKSLKGKLNLANKYCQQSEEGGYNDWRLPNIDELRTLIQNHPGTMTGGTCKISEKTGKLDWKDETDACNGKNGSNFSKLGNSDNLLSSSFADSHNVWFVDFGTGSIKMDRTDYNIYNIHVRCVRSEYNEHHNQQTAPQPASPKEEAVAPTNPTDEPAKQEPKNSSASNELNWSEKASEKMFARDAIDYCENLSENGHNDWRLPTIGELRTLIQNCEGTETGGTCGVTDMCLSQNDCKNKACDGCEDKTVQHSKLGDKGLFWSSSFRPESSNNAWYIFQFLCFHCVIF